MSAPEHAGRVLDWRPRFDERSRDHRLTAAPPTSLPATGRIWRHGGVIDQGSEGACVGMGCAGEAAAEPVPVPGAATFLYALRWYKHAQRLDEWPGDQYSGTSVLAGLQHGRALGLWTGFRWAFSPEELAAGVVRPASRGGGPAVIGVEWRSGSYETDTLGELRPSGPVVGGHCLLVLGFVPAGVKRGSALCGQLQAAGLWDGYLSAAGPVFVLLNSWGESWGRRGLALVNVETMRAWFRARGEFAIPEGRKMPETKTTAERDDQPATPAEETLHLRADQLQARDRITAGVPDAFGQETATVQSLRVVAGGSGDQVQVSTASGRFGLRVGAPVTVRRNVG